MTKSPKVGPLLIFLISLFSPNLGKFAFIGVPGKLEDPGELEDPEDLEDSLDLIVSVVLLRHMLPLQPLNVNIFKSTKKRNENIPPEPYFCSGEQKNYTRVTRLG